MNSGQWGDFAELAAGNRTHEAVPEALQGFVPVDLLMEDQPVPPDYFIRAQAAVRGWQHLTNDDRRLAPWPNVDFIFARPRRS